MTSAAQDRKDRGFNEKIVIVTGASRGLGRAIGELLGGGGAKVVAIARTVGGLEELDDAIQSRGGPPAVLTPLDLTDGDGIDRMCAALFERFGRADLLVHAAAQAAVLCPIAHLSPKDFEKLVAVNVTATARLIRAVHPLLTQAPRPHAAFVTDRKADRAFWGGYGASKGAGEALARSYAAEAGSGDAPVSVSFHEPPPMPTALRSKTHPGEDRAALTPVATAASTVVAEITDALLTR